MRTFPVLSLLVVTAFALSACSGASSTVEAQHATVQTEAQATAIALDYLNQQPFADTYLPDTATATEEDDGWRVLIDHVESQDRRPSVGAIWVDKMTGEASWLPLR